MPVVLRVDGYRFHFYASDQKEPCHIHVSKGEGIGKIWLEPELSVEYMNYFTVRQKKAILEITRANETLLKEKWYEFFGK